MRYPIQCPQQDWVSKEGKQASSEKRIVDGCGISRLETEGWI